MKTKPKKIILIIAIIVALCSTVLIVAFALNTGIAYVTDLIIMEQQDHYYKMNKEIKRMQGAMIDIDEYVEIMQKRIPTEKEREEILKQLRNMEEISLNISRQTGFYQEDTTVHLFFEPSDDIVSYFNQTRNTPLFVERFVRSMEQGVFANSYLSKVKREMILENYELLQKELEDL
jgi:hypothetical protein